jgi:hypothetical protein
MNSEYTIGSVSGGPLSDLQRPFPFGTMLSFSFQVLVMNTGDPNPLDVIIPLYKSSTLA